MSERRYVVEITRTLDPALVAGAADQVAARLDMDPGRIRTLLDGRAGPVTRAVLPEKAEAIAKVFADAGVEVAIVEHRPEDEPENGSGFRQTAGYRADSDETEAPEATAPAGGAGFAQADGEYGETDTDSSAADATAEDAWDDAYSWEAEERSGDQWGEFGRGGTFGRSLRPDKADTEDADAESETADLGDPFPEDDYSADGDESFQVGQDDPAPDEQLGDGAADTGITPDYELKVSRFAAVEPGEDKPETAPAVDVSFEPAGVVQSTTPPPEGALPSTRWVPSPHDESDGRDSPSPAEQSGELERLVTGSSDRWWVPEPSRFGPQPPAPTDERSTLRTYLLWGLLASIVVLVALQFIFAARAGPVGSSYEDGLQAYRAGEFVAARRIWLPLAESGHPQAQFMLGHLVQNGLGQPWSNAQAATWYRSAAEQDVAEAQVALADLYMRGVGVEQSARTAADWLARAAATGYPPAQLAYGRLLFHGTGVERDFAGAMRTFSAAAAAGVADAEDYLAFALQAPALADQPQAGQQ